MRVKFGIRRKLEVFILPIVALAFIVVIMIAYNSSKSSIETKTQKLLYSEAGTLANSVEAWKNRNLGILDNAVDTMIYQKMDREDLLAYESLYLGKYNDFPDGVYIICDDGSVVDATGWVPDEDPRVNEYYQTGKECKEHMTFVEAYIDDLTGEYIVTTARHVDNLCGKGGVVCTDISLAILTDVISGITVEGDGDAFIFDIEAGNMLAHKDSSIRGLQLEEIEDPFYMKVAEFVHSGNQKYGFSDSNDGSYMFSYERIEDTNWIVVVRSLEKNIFSDVKKLGYGLFFVGVVVVLIIVFVLMFLIEKVTTPINKITNAIMSVTDGDFTVEVPVSGQDEVTLMANGVNQFVDVMSQTLSTISDISEKIDDQAHGSNTIANELNESAGSQADAMGSMLDNLNELVKSIATIAEDATTLALVVSDTDESGTKVISNIEDTMKEADSGRNSMTRVTESMNSIKESMDALGRSIGDVGDSAIKIGNITSTIMEIAEQTNLLALNASIEAARAGEAGKGFAVVATEIKGLADTSASAANEISELISAVTKLITDTVRQSKGSVEQIRTSSEIVNQASAQFDHIYDGIYNTNEIVKTMIEKIHKTNDVASNMAAITEEQSASAEEIEASANDVRYLANSVADNSARVQTDSNELASTATDLKERISKFKFK